MDTVTVNGKLYKKASVLAKEFRYTSDYIGQLCRNKKVDCQFVGRSWYVTEASLLAHKDTRYKEVRVDEKTIKNKDISAMSSEEIAVRPRLLKTTLKAEPKSHFSERLIPRESKYYTDETELLPVTQKATRSTRITPSLPLEIPVIVSEAKQVSVKTENRPVKLDFTELPTVSLTGQLVVEEVIPDETPTKPVVFSETEMVEVSEKTSNSNEKVTLIDRKQHRNKPLSFVPSTVVSSQKIAVESRYGLILLAFLSASLLCGFVSLASHEFIVTKNAVATAVVFDPVSLLELAAKLR